MARKRPDGATLSIDVDSFVRTRDSVVTGLATLQDAIQTLSSAYIKHTNAVLGEHGAGLDVESALSRLGDNPLLGGLGTLHRAVSPAKSPTVDDKKERKKRQHDPNAPKRPLTPFFLYMQTARPIIAQDLGPDVAKGAVSAEGTRKWGTMGAEEKQLWANAYKDNLRLYNARMHSYRNGNLEAKDMSDQAAATYAEVNSIGADTTADAQLVGEASAGQAPLLEAEEAAEPTPAPKTPKARASRKSKDPKEKAGKSAQATPAASESVIPVPPVSAAQAKAAKASEKEKSPDKKRKRTSKKVTADEPVNTVEKEEVAAETPKSTAKSRKKKAKADA